MDGKLQTLLDNLQIQTLNEMQQAALAANERDQDLILLSATGSGKTLAFLLPLFLQLKAQVKHTQALIVVPSRELALQIEQVFKKMQTGFKVTCCYGGHKREIEENNLIDSPALIIGTPGRLCDHLRRGSIQTKDIRLLVLDEFDKSLELGFLAEMEFILTSLKHISKKVLTSATEAVDIPGFLALNNAQKLSFLTQETELKNSLDVKKIVSDSENKFDILFRFLCKIGNRSTIVFCNHREAVERVSNQLYEKGIYNEFYHGAMEQRDRDSALNKFRNGTVNILVTTDLAARGLDIPNIRYIIHYQLPQTQDIYTHRNGRTARMEASGTVVLFLSSTEYLPPYVDQDIEEIELPAKVVLPEKTKWVTFFIAAGKKDKVNKIDIVGFLSQKAELKKEDIGLIEVKDFHSFVAVNRLKSSNALRLIKDQRIKNKKVKIEIAK
ncbi:DEAD/DEAH box helicase [Arachidicoccus sp.]|uniref:DEAD/DEAH box helicase n=1 Tax=Arachidicoccus sp. TaxID=1872624 RepID=UPI003D193213